MSRVNDLYLRSCKIDYRVVNVTGKNQYKFQDFLNEKEMTNIIEGYYVFGAEKNGIGLGVIVFHMNDNDIDLLRINVRREYRRRGVGASLVAEMKRMARIHDITKIYTRYCIDESESEEYSEFLRDCGFYRTDEQTELMIFNSADMIASPLFQKFKSVKSTGKDILRIDEIPIAYFNALKARLGDQLPEELLPSHALGKIMTDLSFGYLQNDKLRAYVIFTLLNGRLYLNSAYTDAGANVSFMNMLSAALVKIGEKYSDISEISVYLINENSKNLARNLTKDFSDKLMVQTIDSYMWDEFQEMGDYDARRNSQFSNGLFGVDAGFAVLVPKLMRLADFLGETGIDATIMGLEMPSLFIQYQDFYIMVRYLLTDEEAGSFMITFSVPVPNGKEAEAIRDSLNYSKLAVEGNDAVLRMCLNEGTEPIDRNAFLAAYSAFVDEASNIVAFT